MHVVCSQITNEPDTILRKSRSAMCCIEYMKTAMWKGIEGDNEGT